MARKRSIPDQPLPAAPPPYNPATWEKIVAFSVAGVVVLFILICVFSSMPFDNPNKVALIRILLSLAVAVLGAVIPGFLNVGLNSKGVVIRAGGALALFVTTFFFTPTVLAQPSTDPPSDARPPGAASGKAVISLDVSVQNEPPPQSWGNGKDTIVTYSLQHDDRGIRIQPTMGYLSRFEAGGPIEPLNYMGRTPFDWDFPKLDFKVLNNSPNTIYLTELILDVEESVLDPISIIAIKGDDNGFGSFLLTNEGWSDLHDITVRYAMIPGEVRDAPSVKEYPFVCHVATLTDSATIPILDAFQRMGVDIRGLERLTKAERVDKEHLTISNEAGMATTISQEEWERRRTNCLGAFENGIGTVIGTIDFTNATVEGEAKQHSVAFRTPVRLSGSRILAVAEPSSYEYQAQFEVSMSRYQKRVLLSQEVKPGDTDRFSAKIAVNKSSQHRFRATVRDIQGNLYQLPAVELTVFVPRSAENIVKGYKLKAIR
jgi:hypothetical protein